MMKKKIMTKILTIDEVSGIAAISTSSITAVSIPVSTAAVATSSSWSTAAASSSSAFFASSLVFISCTLAYSIHRAPFFCITNYRDPGQDFFASPSPQPPWLSSPPSLPPNNVVYVQFPLRWYSVCLWYYNLSIWAINNNNKKNKRTFVFDGLARNEALLTITLITSSHMAVLLYQE